MLVTFDVDKSVYLGDQTEAAIKTKSLLGAKILEITPRGDDRALRDDPSAAHHAALSIARRPGGPVLDRSAS